jgi:hypothetical protein
LNGAISHDKVTRFLAWFKKAQNRVTVDNKNHTGIFSPNKNKYISQPLW